MIRIELKRIGKSPALVLENLEKEWFILQGDLFELGEQVHQAMLLHITSNKQRPQVLHPHGSPGSQSKLSLEDAIKLDIYSEPAQFSFGIGNIDFLNANAPHWYWINYGKAQSGRVYPPETIGQFQPGTPQPDLSAFRSGILMPGLYSVIPQKKMPAMNYIEMGEYILTNGLNKIIDRLKRGIF
ncbi:MAG: hypothetical protein ACTSPD_10490 [Promethearchaeota archaeon]